MEQKAHDVFTRIAGREEPPLGFTAEGLAARGRRQARVRRAGTVAGGAVGTLAVTAVVLPLASLGSGGRHTGPAVAVTTPTASTAPTAPPTTPAPAATTPVTTASPDPGCVADLEKIKAPDGNFEGQDRTAALQACPVLKRVDAVLDPQGTHLSAASPGFLHSAPVDIINGYLGDGDMSKFEGLESQISWTPDGHYPFKNNNRPDMSGPYVQVWITILAAGASDLYTTAPDHRNNGQGYGAGTRPAWSPEAVTTLKDGSTVSLKREQDSAGATAVATRTLASGAKLILYVNGPYQEPGTNTLPFTDEQLVAAVSVPGVEDVRLPIDSGFPPGGVRPSPPNAASTSSAATTPSGVHSSH